jgi:hypothetical protein
MVWESFYWKQKLKQISFEIDAYSNERDPSDMDVANLEIAVFTAFYLVRKLLEAQTKLSNKVSNLNVHCLVLEKFEGAPPVDLMNRYDTFKLYKHHEFEKRSVSIVRVCNLFIHSIFMWMDYDEAEDFVAGVRLTSSFEKDKAMYRIKITEIQRVLSRVIEDNVDKLEMRRDKATGELKVVKQ